MEFQRPDLLTTLKLLQAYGIPVQTILDIGAAEGAFFPLRWQAGIYLKADHFFIDAMEENKPLYEKVAAHYGGGYEICALANLNGEIELSIDPGFYNTHIGGIQPSQTTYGKRRVPVRPLDDVVRAHNLQGPFLVKMDVQGAELDVLRGATETLRQASIVTLEAQVCLFRDTLLDHMAYLRSQGFVLYDITNLSYYQSDFTLYQCLATFIPQRLDFRKMAPHSDPAVAEQERQRLEARRQQVCQTVEQMCATRAAQSPVANPVHVVVQQSPDSPVNAPSFSSGARPL